MLIRSFDDDFFWTVITQIDHARLSFELSKTWGTPPFLPIVEKEAAEAIRHHDDGWRSWDEALHFRNGKPIPFNEMRWEDVRPIWEKSIAIVASIGDLAAYITTRHFLILSENGGKWSEDEAEFNRTYGSKAMNWKNAWLAKHPDATAGQRAELALNQLRFFDFLSIVLCIEPITTEQPLEIVSPEGRELTISKRLSVSDAANDTQSHLLLNCSPWPWTTEIVSVTVPTVRISKTIAQEAGIAPLKGERTLLSWEIRPA